MTPPSDRSDTEDWLAEREEEAAVLFGSLAYEATLASVTAYADGLRTVTAGGDPAKLDDLNVIWRQFLAGPGSEYIAGMHLAGHLSAFIGAADTMPNAAQGKWADVANRNAADYQKTALNRMSDDTFWPDIRRQVTTKLSDGMTMPELRREVEAISGYSRSRAQAIARTESLTAYNRGDIAGARALGPYGPAEKVWSAARDSRTRPTHAEASGQCVPLSEPFDVGGVKMDSPGADGAPAAEVVNCRCSMLMLYPGDTRPDGTKIPEEGTVYAPTPAAPEQDVLGGRTVSRTREGPENWRPDIAREYGVTSQDLYGNFGETQRLRKQVRAEAAEAQYVSLGWLENAEALHMRRPGRNAGGEYDWYKGLSKKEKARLSRWFVDDDKAGIDVIHQAAQSRGAIPASASIDDFAQEWLHHTRVVDMASSVRSGRWPATSSRFGGLDPETLVPKTRSAGFDPGRLIGVDFDHANGHVASVYKHEAADRAYSVLGPQSIGSEAPPWRMSFQAWEDEVRTLEESSRTAAAASKAWSPVEASRYRELVPDGIDTGQDYEVLYAEVVETARIADLDVADWARIPWEVA